MSEQNISYSVRPTIRKEVFTYTLEDEAIHMTSDRDKDEKLFYRDIQRINITTNQGYYICTVYSAKGDKFRIGSYSAGDNELEHFVPFVKELHSKLDAYEDSIEFTRGSAVNFYVITITLSLLLAFLVVIVPFAIIKGKLIDIILYVIIGFIVIITLGVGLLPKIKPKNYQPKEDGLPYSIDKAAKLLENSKADE